MNKNKELIYNTIIIFIGKFSTQFVSFLLVPIYTHYLLTSDYGYVDLIQTYVMLLAPMIILRFDSAIFRFLIDYRDDKDGKNKIITSSAYLLFFQLLLTLVLFCIINFFVRFEYSLGILLNIVFVSISSYLLQLTRGIGKNIDYSIASIISGVITVTVNVMLIVCFKYNVSTILYASTLANIFCSLLEVYYVSRIFKNIVTVRSAGIYIGIVLYSIFLGAGLYSYWLYLSLFCLVYYDDYCNNNDDKKKIQCYMKY